MVDSWTLDLERELRKKLYDGEGRIEEYLMHSVKYRVTSLAHLAQHRAPNPLPLQYYCLFAMTPKQLLNCKKGPPYYPWEIRKLASMICLVRHPYFTTYYVDRLCMYIEECYEFGGAFYSTSLTEMCRQAKKYIKENRYFSDGGRWRTWFEFTSFVDVRTWATTKTVCDCIRIFPRLFKTIRLESGYDVKSEKKVNAMYKKFNKEVERQLYDGHYRTLGWMFEQFYYCDCDCMLDYTFKVKKFL